MFAYCLNNPINYFDRHGHDAIWIHESGSAGGFGHTGLLVQDNGGIWYYFYWGPKSESADIKNLLAMLTIGTTSNCVLVRVEVDANDLCLQSDIEDVTDVLKNSEISFVKERADKITNTYYFVGDYSLTLLYLAVLKGASAVVDYHLTNNNCVQNTWRALSVSNPRFLLDCPTIPDAAYMKMLLMYGEYDKLAEFMAKEVDGVDN